MRKMISVSATLLLGVWVLTLGCQMPLWLGFITFLPVVVATIITRLLLDSHWPSKSHKMGVPIGLVGGFFGCLCGPLGFVGLTALSNPNITGARDGLSRCITMMPILIGFGFATSYILAINYPADGSTIREDEP